jgi:hypothetical protein
VFGLGLVARANGLASLLPLSFLFPIVFGVGRVSAGHGPDVRVGDGRGEVVELEGGFAWGELNESHI